ncbi:ATP-dependent helicase [Candidatus Amesbacteria bacterium]|nr:ATP-dependent helicase [Candidatus Amesbacteria bacterium]
MAEKTLNKQQLEAVTHGSGPLLIIAGAGTGKTTVVTERVKWLISQGLAQPSEILCLTFTEKAATEMQERIDIALPYGYTQMWVSTFHSFCDRILRDEGLHLGLDTNYKLLTDSDAVSLLKKHLFDFKLDYYRPLGNPTKFLTAILQHFSRLQDEDVSPDQYLEWSKNQDSNYQELAGLYRDFLFLKAQEGFMDFSDLITSALQLFRNRPGVLKLYQQKFKYILVDEFQDTNYSQNQLVNLLASRDRNLTVVADDDQAIYRWRGAAISNVIQFRKNYPDAKLITLVQNFRSTQEILDKAYALIQNNNPDRLEIAEKIDKKLVSVRKIKGDKIEFLHSDRVESEADATAKKIKELLEIGHLSLKDFAILVRANAHAEPFARALSRRGISHQFLGPGRLFHRPEIKDLIAYLKVLYNFEDNASFYRVLVMDFFAVPARDIAVLTNLARKQNISLYEACEQSLQPSVKTVVDLIDRHLHLIPKATAGQILYDFLEKSGLLKAILDYKAPIDETTAQNIMQFFNKLKSFETQNSDASVHAVVDWLNLSSDMGESPLAAEVDWSANDAVNILTIHSAKGLEFPVVFLVNLVIDRFPSRSRSEPIPVPDDLIKEILPVGDFHLQEERRLFYVGLTRAKDKLFLTASDFYGDGKRARKLSPFVPETLGPIQPSNHSTIQPSLLDWQKTEVPLSPSSPALSTKINYLSYSQIQTFLDCPLHYKAKYILKIPTPPSAASSFGNTIHATLKDFYSHPGSDILELLKRNWSSEGYSSKKHEQAYLSRGQKYLTGYLQANFNPKHLPVKLEEPFMVPLSPMLKIGGKIDRVDQLPDGKIEIIDYKTSVTIPTQKDADKDLQLSFYALVATLLREPPFNRKPEDVLLSLYFFDQQKKISTTRTTSQLEEAKHRIFSYADQISRSDFTCSGSQLCQMCDFKILCDVTA